MTAATARMINASALRDGDLIVVDGRPTQVAHPIVRNAAGGYDVTLLADDDTATVRAFDRDEQVPCALSGQQEIDLREQAVMTVDARYGYTMEFSSCPPAHADEYDREEQRLRLAAASADQVRAR